MSEFKLVCDLLRTVKCTKLANNVVLQNMMHGTWAMTIYCCVHNESPLVSAPRQVNPAHALPSYFFKTHFNMFPFLDVSPTKTLYAFLISSPYVLRECTILRPAFYLQNYRKLFIRNHGITFILNHLT